jgi:hypothetical protein
MDSDEKMKILKEIGEIRAMMEKLGGSTQSKVPATKTGVRTLFLF